MNSETIGGVETMAGGEKPLLAGRYRVVRQLGQGGMGSVWLAEDTALDNRQVAIKMLPSILFANKRSYQQIKSEALVSLKLTHPNIATLRGFEENKGNPFLVIDFIDGRSLDDVLAERGALSEEETKELLKPVAAALDYAHKKGVVHRDVKPGNVMVAKDGTPFVLDFGIAREMQETLTRVTGKLSSGTLLYMSPEQLRGEVPTPAQDVYSFAALAYECLAGHPPFHRGQVEFQILNEPPPPLPADTPLARSILRGLAKDPAARPASCRAVIDAVTTGPRTEGAVDGTGPTDAELASLQAQIENLEQKIRQKRDQERVQAEAAKQKQRRAQKLAAAQAKLAALKKENAQLDDAADTVRVVTLPGGAELRFRWCPAGNLRDLHPSANKPRVGFWKSLFGCLVEEAPSVSEEPVAGFWMGETQVTQAQWTSVMGNNPSHFKGGDRPVECVSWDDCQVFCKKCAEAGVKVRLPTEREWEYACRAGSKGDWGKRANGKDGPLDAMGWYGDNSGSETHPVAQKEPNAWGLYDMHGNVWEWCEDADGSNRVLRGGSRNSDSGCCTAGGRYRFDPDLRDDFLGFRLALSQD